MDKKDVVFTHNATLFRHVKELKEELNLIYNNMKGAVGVLLSEM